MRHDHFDPCRVATAVAERSAPKIASAVGVRRTEKTHPRFRREADTKLTAKATKALKDAATHDDLLASLEKRIERTRTYLHWLCLDPDLDAEIWLRYYATDEERDGWASENGSVLPPAERPPYPRKVPRGPMD